MEQGVNIYSYVDESLHELISHGRPEFPVAFYGDGITPLKFKPHYAHWHNEVEITIAVKGSVEISCNDEIITLKEGQAILINSNVLHCILHKNNPDSVVRIVIFNPVLVYGYHNSEIERKYVNPIINSPYTYYLIKGDEPNSWGHQFVESILKAFRFNVNKRDGYELGVKIMLLDAWYIFYRNVEKGEVINSNYSSKVKLVKSAINYIHENYSKDITLLDIADASNLSKSELCKLFKKYVNQSPIQYLLRKRVSSACYYLAYTDKNITEISKTVGIEDSNYFAIIFKKIMKESPSSYRKRKVEDSFKD